MAAAYQIGGVRACLSIAIFAAILITADAQSTTTQSPQTNTSNGSNGSNVTAAPVCHTDCCDKPALKFEARTACKSLSQWGIKDSTCFLWEYNARRSCKEYCSNCTEISRAMYDQCLFFLNGAMTFDQAMARCRILGNDFNYNGRCDSACKCSLDDCYSTQGKYCMQQCGNYQGCGCYKIRGTIGEPDKCDGETVIKGFMPGTTIKYSCVHTPRLCKNHLAPQSACAKYKHCKLDMCLVKNITCDITDDCQAYGVCEKSTGKCFYTLKPDGSKCNDGKYFTHDDTCVAGSCVGWIDKCLRDGVECGTSNPCLKPQGTCSARTGACIFEKREEGIGCSFQPGDPHNGNCTDGVCRRPVVDKCFNKTCSPDGGPCRKAIYPRCDPETGNCRWIWRPEGTKCDDGNPNTFNEMCIEGQCRGDEFASPMYESIGEGHCANQHGFTLQRYFRDAFDDEACASQCSKDPTCRAYGFSYHQCNIYHFQRALHPEMTFWGEQWFLGNMWGDMSIANLTVVDWIVPLSPDEPKVKCMRKVASVEEKVVNTPIIHEIVFGFLLFMLVCSPAFYYCMWRVKKHFVALDEKYLAEHEDDERTPVHDRGCNRLRCKCCRRYLSCVLHAEDGDDESCLSWECLRKCLRRRNQSERRRQKESDETLIQPMEEDNVVEDDTGVDGPTPILQGDEDKEQRESSGADKETEPQRGCCSRCCSCLKYLLTCCSCLPCRCCASIMSSCRCCCCRRKPKTTQPSKLQDVGGPSDEKLDDAFKDERTETPVHIESLPLEDNNPTSLQPALSPRETGKGSSAVAMAPNTAPENEDTNNLTSLPPALSRRATAKSKAEENTAPENEDPNAVRDPRGAVEPDVQVEPDVLRCPIVTGNETVPPIRVEDSGNSVVRPK